MNCLSQSSRITGIYWEWTYSPATWGRKGAIRKVWLLKVCVYGGWGQYHTISLIGKLHKFPLMSHFIACEKQLWLKEKSCNILQKTHTFDILIQKWKEPWNWLTASFYGSVGHWQNAFVNINFLHYCWWCENFIITMSKNILRIYIFLDINLFDI